ncbi:phosphoribosylglycinamide formyltransferase [Luteimonas sp. BDR2-5]|uniref:phosphoribosylglycinamide formyltransferase n=1 Tax=Proluteimonas luteida TaxID=2878685 RepID=UPI001E64A318|nr:phosphoribosylglycinamide formyltransferase [Luteimonas sp. BDR2-5]MCD9029262.1 phosphoribosylglycinamide formyltransferase [Luteimonas sp. BDR2-5]
MTLRIAVLASGRGSNLQAIIDAIAAGTLDATLAGVYSDRRDAFALQRARDAGIPAHAVRPRDHADRAAHDAALFAAVDACVPDLIVCAGYMRLIGAPEVDARPGRMINIHPSLLPAFKGLHTHQQALDAGVAEHGASVHFVTADLDGGPVIAQAKVPVLPGDTADTLAARVLAREHPLLLETLRALAAGRVRLDEEGLHIDGQAGALPLQLGANNRFA